MSGVRERERGGKKCKSLVIRRSYWVLFFKDKELLLCKFVLLIRVPLPFFFFFLDEEF